MWIGDLLAPLHVSYQSFLAAKCFEGLDLFLAPIAMLPKDLKVGLKTIKSHTAPPF